MLQAVKGNKVYDVSEEQADAYAAEGYDVYKGKKVYKHAAGKAVPWAKYEKALAEVAELKAQLKKDKAE